LQQSGFVVMKRPPIGGQRRSAAVMRIDTYVGSGVAMGLTGWRKPTPRRSSATMHRGRVDLLRER
jgi:hypothetical protein